MASTFTLKRKTFGRKFNEYIKKNNLKVEDAKIIEEGAKKLKFGKPAKIATGLTLLGLTAGGVTAALKNKKRKQKED